MRVLSQDFWGATRLCMIDWMVITVGLLCVCVYVKVVCTEQKTTYDHHHHHRQLCTGPVNSWRGTSSFAHWWKYSVQYNPVQPEFGDAQMTNLGEPALSPSQCSGRVGEKQRRDNTVVESRSVIPTHCFVLASAASRRGSWRIAHSDWPISVRDDQCYRGQRVHWYTDIRFVTSRLCNSRGFLVQRTMPVRKHLGENVCCV
jgi:hypothetical protein